MKRKNLYIILIVLTISGLIFIKSNLIINHFFEKQFLPRQTSTSNDINVLLITIDALRPDHLGAYGYERNTGPNIDKVAREGVLFSNTVAQASLTWPSLTSMMTSTYPDVHGVLKNDRLVDLSIPTLAEILKKNGFATAAFVSNMCIDNTLRQDEIKIIGGGFDHKFCGMKRILGKIVGTERMWDRDITLNAIDWLEDNRNKKFFLWVHYISPHHPYRPPSPYNKIFDPDYNGSINGSAELLKYITKNKINLTEKDLRHIIALYDGEILSADEYVGQLLKGLDKYNLTKNTLIIISADHGEELYDHYYFGRVCSLHDSTLKIPLIIKLPSTLPKGKVIEDQVQSIDIAPSILEILGIPLNKYMQGNSLVPLIKGKNNTNLYAYSQLPKKIYSIRTNQWKYIYNPDDVNPCPRAGNFDLEKEELYNLKTDPKETINLIDQDEEIAEGLKNQLLSWLEEIPRNETVTGYPLDEETKRMLKGLGYLE